jgi:asparagine synthase (glutamine-hydrolysing)
MCGIAGVLGARDPVAAEALTRQMIHGLVHRGPDGVRVERAGTHVLAHARLSIIDLEGGWQPLHAAGIGTGATVIGNGEIYNYVELREAFSLQDVLATGSDFEPLIHLYGREGMAAFQRLRGMYGLCLIGGDGRVFLVRDPYGIKPLHVRQLADGVAFASEPAVLAPLPRPAMDPAVGEDLLTLGYVVGPDSLGVESLDPGEIAEVAEGRLVRHVGTLPRVPGPRRAAPVSEAEALKALDQVLEDSVAVHQRSDVPYGLFLSGGIDSSIIATLMARLNARPVTAFTCGFDVPGAADERRQAEAVATALGLDWREVSFTEEDFWRLAPVVAGALDAPTTDYACLPTLKLAEAAKGVLTVVLSGEGGDELFAGYGRYRRALRPRWLGGRAAEPRARCSLLADQGAAAVARWRTAAANDAPTLLARAQEADVRTWLPDDLLLKLDRCLMAVGLEGRTPFLDREVAAFAASLPDGLKVRGRMGKWILRQWLAENCPAAAPFARKQGFTVPVASWIAPRAAALGPKLAAVEGVRQIASPDAVRAVFADDAHAGERWPLLFFALWWIIHHGGATPAEAMAEVVG